MDVFKLRENLIADYSSFVRGFIRIRNPRISDLVEKELKEGLLWPEPLIQLNPFFEPGDSLAGLIASQALHPLCDRIFRIKEDEADMGDRQIRLYRHQSEAIYRANAGHNYVLTTGTGSGKSLAYIIPIVNHVLNAGSGKGIKAIIVYPMNALANSQAIELGKFINHGFAKGSCPVTFRRYTGQESEQEKEEICTNPPDILLTNYVMLEYILTRPTEAKLVTACRDLRFLVLDELHTYRGRQGADVAMLIRRTREATGARDVVCVGTSATLSSAGDLAAQNREIACVASLIFGSEVRPDNVIGEYLQRLTTDYDFEAAEVVKKLKRSVVDGYPGHKPDFESLRNNPLAAWIETTYGLETETGGTRLHRAKPKTITGEGGGAELLSLKTGLDKELCAEAIQAMLLLGSAVKNPASGFPLFAFKLHQFISRGDTVYASIDLEADRYLTAQKQVYVPNSNKQRLLLPLAFCRDCGQEFYSVSSIRDEAAGQERFIARGVNERIQKPGEEPGYLYPADEIDYVDAILPAEWKDIDGAILKARKKDRPRKLHIRPDGTIGDDGLPMLYLKSPFRFCPQCGVTYSSYQRSDFAKLSALGTEGRSTATTVLSLSAVRHIRRMDLDDKAKKLLSFTDNRQDASLQAGHFNDFIRVGLIRGALYHALVSSDARELRNEELCLRVFESLDLKPEDYAENPELDPHSPALRHTQEALRDVLGYLLYQDLKRGWRITAPNLEQTGLLEIRYDGLDELAGNAANWENAHAALATADPQTRLEVLHTLLDQLRRELAINVSYLDPQKQESMLQRHSLNQVWGFDESMTVKQLTHAGFMFPRSKDTEKDSGDHFFMSPLGSFGRYLRQAKTFRDHPNQLSVDEAQELILDLLDRLVQADFVKRVTFTRRQEAEYGYQLNADTIIWVAGDGSKPFNDPTRITSEARDSQRINTFFQEYYKLIAASTGNLRAEEHTAQISYEKRERREQSFREAALPVLYCSPTMELGIDISTLNMVNLRNIPPNPANYAQRGGRAGRGGQPALIFTYCSSGSPHDQYFFKRPLRMVSGAVATPQIELANEELLRSHVNAIWLSESGLSLGKSLAELLDLEGDDPSLELLDSKSRTIEDLGIRQRALARAESILASMQDHLESAGWYDPDWLGRTLNQLPLNFKRACERWQDLYRAAINQRNTQNQKWLQSINRRERDQAERLRREAESQIALLKSTTDSFQSDFYSYRYFASEGFLPGYSFPRLPLSAFIPGKKVKNSRDDYLSRPRFLAITEFGPRSLIYHEGSRYIINQVILPVQNADNQLNTKTVKICPACGYLHEEDDGEFKEFCDNCETRLGNGAQEKLSDLLRLQNVVAKRRDQINCDEEERLRMGFDVRSSLRFASRLSGISCLRSTLMHGQETVATLTYGDAAEIWRINLGYRKHKEGEPEGFLLDAERGYWGKRDDDDTPDDDAVQARRTLRVKPYVSDHKNCLLFELNIAHEQDELVSLQYALKNAIQHVFELEDNELAAEPLPSRDNRRSILFYEAAEGGAGVLRRLLDADDFRRVVIEAIDLCHFDPETLEDRGRAIDSKEDCEAGCYDCLLSYYNQADHELIDRKKVINLLASLHHATLERSSSHLGRKNQYELLKKKTDTRSDLEREWLELIYNDLHNLPTDAQYLIPEANTKPDFVYCDRYDAWVAIYIDGTPHDAADVAQRDREIDRLLLNLGWLVLRFRHDEREGWKQLILDNANIFGRGK